MAAVLSGRTDWSWPVVTWTLVGVTVSFVLTLFFFRGHRSKRKYKLPPGPTAYPIVGNAHLLNDSKKLPHQIVDELAKTYGPIMMLKMGAHPMVFISDPGLTMECLKSQDHLFANRPPTLIKNTSYLFYGDQHVIFGQKGGQHTFYRKLLVTELLSNQKTQSFQGMRMEEQTRIIRESFDASVRKEPIDLKHLFNSMMVNVIARMAFGLKVYGNEDADDELAKSQQKWTTMIPEMAHLAGEVLAENIHPALKWIDSWRGIRQQMQSCHGRMDAMLLELLDAHKKNLDGLSPKQLEAYEAKDFLDILLLMRGDEHIITDTYMKSVSMDLVAAGTDTLTVTLEWAMAELLLHPDMMKRVLEEVDSVVGYDRTVEEADVANLPYLTAFMKENFRLHPPLAWNLPHGNRVDCKVGGYDIPAESAVIFNIYGMSRSESLWGENSLEFNPDRFLGDSSIAKHVDVKGANAELLPFGSGRRMCPAMNLALVLGQSTLARLIHSFDWSLEGGVDPRHYDMSAKFDLVLAKKLPLIALPKARLPIHLYN